MKKRILIILTPPLDPTMGGVQKSSIKLAGMLEALDYDVCIFSFASSGHAKQYCKNLVFVSHKGGVAEKRNMECFIEHLDNYSPDIIINQMPYERKIGRVLKNRTNIVRVACLHNTLFSVVDNLDNYAKTILPTWLLWFGRSVIGGHMLLCFHRTKHAHDLSRILNNYDRFIMLDESSREELSFFLPNYKPEKIAIIPHNVEELLKSVPTKEQRILWLGRVNKVQKCADLIIPLWERLSSKIPDWEFDIVGDGSLLPELRKMAIDRGLSRINFHGRQPARGYFERSAIFVMTSDFEAWGLTLTEAQSAGAVPVLFDTFTMARYLVSDKNNGILVPPGDLDKMVDEIIELCYDPDRRNAMAECGLESLARFTTPVVQQKWSKLLQRITAQQQ